MVLRKGTLIKPVGEVPGTESGNVIRKGLNCATFHIQLSQFGCKAINYRINPKKLVPLCFSFQVGKKMNFFCRKCYNQFLSGNYEVQSQNHFILVDPPFLRGVPFFSRLFNKKAKIHPHT